MKPVEIPRELEVITKTKYLVPASGVLFFMEQSATENGFMFQFHRLTKSFEHDDSEPVSSIMSIQDVEKLMELMKSKTEHEPCLMFGQHYVLTEDENEFILLFQIIEKYFYPICENLKSISNMIRIQNKQKVAAETGTEMLDLVGHLDTETETEADSTTDSNE